MADIFQTEPVLFSIIIIYDPKNNCVAFGRTIHLHLFGPTSGRSWKHGHNVETWLDKFLFLLTKRIWEKAMVNDREISATTLFIHIVNVIWRTTRAVAPEVFTFRKKKVNGRGISATTTLFIRIAYQ